MYLQLDKPTTDVLGLVTETLIETLHPADQVVAKACLARINGMEAWKGVRFGERVTPLPDMFRAEIVLRLAQYDGSAACLDWCLTPLVDGYNSRKTDAEHHLRRNEELVRQVHELKAANERLVREDMNLRRELVETRNERDRLMLEASAITTLPVELPVAKPVAKKPRTKNKPEPIAALKYDPSMEYDWHNGDEF